LIEAFAFRPLLVREVLELFLRLPRQGGEELLPGQEAVVVAVQRLQIAFHQAHQGAGEDAAVLVVRVGSGALLGSGHVHGAAMLEEQATQHRMQHHPVGDDAGRGGRLTRQVGAAAVGQQDDQAGALRLHRLAHFRARDQCRSAHLRLEAVAQFRVAGTVASVIEEQRLVGTGFEVPVIVQDVFPGHLAPFETIDLSPPFGDVVLQQFQNVLPVARHTVGHFTIRVGVNDQQHADFAQLAVKGAGRIEQGRIDLVATALGRHPHRKPFVGAGRWYHSGEGETDQDSKGAEGAIAHGRVPLQR
jgi:hypothetical protein